MVPAYMVFDDFFGPGAALSVVGSLATKNPNALDKMGAAVASVTAVSWWTYVPKENPFRMG